STTGDIGSLKILGTVNDASDLPGIDFRILCSTLHELGAGSSLGDFFVADIRNPQGGYVTLGNFVVAGSASLRMNCAAFDVFDVYGVLAGSRGLQLGDEWEEIHFRSLPAGRTMRIGAVLAENIYA